MRRLVLTVFLIFFVTRFLFLANYPHFYDSPEYLRLSREPTLSTALTKSHESLHPIYIFLTQTANKLYLSFRSPDLTGTKEDHFIDFKDFMDFMTPLSFLSAFFGLLTFSVFYFLVKRLFNKKTALLSLIPLVFFPHLWLIQTNILHEAVDHFFLITSFLFFDFFLSNRKLINFITSLLFVFLSLINFVGNLIWIPIFVGLFIYRKSKK